jgi:RNA polymerase-interacting CarD/CdnL/TRCF family regulator
LRHAIFEQNNTALRQVVSDKQAEALCAVPHELETQLATTWDLLQQDVADEIKHQVLVPGGNR